MGPAVPLVAVVPRSGFSEPDSLVAPAKAGAHPRPRCHERAPASAGATMAVDVMRIALRRTYASPMKRRPTPTVTDDDAALFRDAIGDVRRIEVEDTAVARPPPTPEPRMRERDEDDALKESRFLPTSAEAFALGEPLSYRRDEIPAKTLKRLAAGEYAVQDEVDLHHLPEREAEALLKAFLTHARQERHHCVRVIHGKGLRSEAGPVLKAMVDGVLRHRGDVLAFASAPASQGGTGAALVLLGK